ncbi:hypothetical protein [Psittacicella gerlachiana]|uniref:TcmA/NAT10 helicase domain-containing protein n=1 Tax=Psittacicella gerlachiana TaxID=2028574 RepID=A0A3A1YME2_9GAMM|nr:hypothetical protein [Psittacicella gerlachiana]RIY38428.1 hypothetical protein CKF59_01025 [Psittacicella gerlachiana]
MLYPRQLVLRLKESLTKSYLNSQLEDLQKIITRKPGLAAWLVPELKPLLVELASLELRDFAFLDAQQQVILGDKEAKYQVVVLEVKNSKRILGYNFVGVVYDYPQSSTTHAHYLLYCLATVQAQGIFCLYIGDFATGSYHDFVLERAKYFAHLSLEVVPELVDFYPQQPNFVSQTTPKMLAYRDFWQNLSQVTEKQVQAQLDYQQKFELIKQRLQEATPSFHLFIGDRGTGKTKFSLDLAREFQATITSLGKRHSFVDLNYLAPELVATTAGNVLIVDEASALSAAVLQKILQSSWQHVIFVATLDGYESGAGVGLWHKVVRDLVPQTRTREIYYFNWHYRALEPDILSLWQEQLCGTTSLVELLESSSLAYIPMTQVQLSSELPSLDLPQVEPAQLEQVQGEMASWQLSPQLRLVALSSFAQKLEFFKLAYLTHYRHQVQDFASAFTQQLLFGLYDQDQLIGGIHLIPESYASCQDIVTQIIYGTRLPPGNLGLQTLSQYFALDSELFALEAIRVSRIFLKPKYRRQGLAQAMLKFTTASYPLTLVMYSQDAGTEAFWQAKGFTSCCYLENPNKSTARANILALKVGSEMYLQNWEHESNPKKQGNLANQDKLEKLSSLVQGLGELYQLEPQAETFSLQQWKQTYPYLASKLEYLYQLYLQQGSSEYKISIKEYRIKYARLAPLW